MITYIKVELLSKNVIKDIVLGVLNNMYFTEMYTNDGSGNKYPINSDTIIDIIDHNERYVFSCTERENRHFSFKLDKQEIFIIAIDCDDSLFCYLIAHLDLSKMKYITRNLSEYMIFNSDMAANMNYWKYENMPVPEPMVYIPEFSFTEPNHRVLSIEHIPSHAHRMTDTRSDELIFEACWQMYFGEIYYKYIPKPLFDAFIECEENVILEHGLRKVTLYRNPEDFGKPHAVARQWAFRRQLGIDSIGHELTYNSNRIEPTDLPVFITKKNCIKGTTRVTRFLDSENRLVPSLQAAKKEIKEYLDDGITVVDEKIEVINQ